MVYFIYICTNSENMDKVIKYTVKDNDPIYENDIKSDIKDIMGFQDYRMVVCQEDNNGIFTVMSFLNNSEVNGIDFIFSKYNMLIGSSDITNDVLSGRYQSQYPDTFNHRVYKSIMEDFILENANVDNILDKISEYGVESLTNDDRIILGNC